MSSVTNSLNDIFKKHRLVFWYDPEVEMRDEFDAYQASSVIKLEVQNNEFSLKHRMMRDEVEQSFLLYLPYARPKNSDNWFLDLELGHKIFHADGISMILQEFGWQEEYRTFVAQYRDFFNSKDRKERFLSKLNTEDDERDYMLKMLSVVCRESPTLEACLLSLLGELVTDKTPKWDFVKKYKLEEFVWSELERSFDYQSESPSLLDFVIEVFISAAPCGKEAKLGREARFFLTRWKDNVRYREVFEKLSAKLGADLNISSQLNAIDGYHTLIDQDAFEAIDRKIIIELRDSLLAGQLTAKVMKEALEHRELLYWFDSYKHLYLSLLAAVELNETIRGLDLRFNTSAEGIDRYSKTYWKVDQLYRHFHYYRKMSGQTTLLDSIRDEIDLRYLNEFLLRLGDQFQNTIDSTQKWPPAGVMAQNHFFKDHVAPIISKGNKLFVIISDALRYEVAEELNQQIMKEDRYKSGLSYHAGLLPSYTQLGMAALLPQQSLQIDPDNAQVKANGLKTSGLEARKTVLATSNYRTTAIKAKDFLELNTKQEGRELSRDHDLVYIYQNGIDHIGDKRETETEVFTAASKEIETLIKILKKITAINGSNVLITADHGFLYQEDISEDSDFTKIPDGENIGDTNRRFAFGSKFSETKSSVIYKASTLGLDGDYEVAIPKSINRYRKQGAGTRFVHGGSSLQEIVVPILTINKSRESDTEMVGVDVIRTGSNLIASSQVAISFYQEQAVLDKVLARKLRIGFYSQDNELLSELKELTFDSIDENPRVRERKQSFIFSKTADKAKYRNAEIILRLEEPITGTNQFRIYKEFPYRLKKAFETDFEF